MQTLTGSGEGGTELPTSSQEMWVPAAPGVAGFCGMLCGRLGGRDASEVLAGVLSP